MKIRDFFYTVAAAAIVGFVAGPVAAQDSGSLPNYLFSQYHTQPGASSSTAAMYPAPHPTPAHVGHSYYTYQPLMPHEMMYSHSRNYYNFYAGPDSYYAGGRYHGGGGLNKTTVKWQSGTNHMGPLPGMFIPLQRIHSKAARHWYRAPQYGPRGRGFGLHGASLGGGCLGGSCGSETGSCDTDYGYAYDAQYGPAGSTASRTNQTQNR